MHISTAFHHVITLLADIETLTANATHMSYRSNLCHEDRVNVYGGELYAIASPGLPAYLQLQSTYAHVCLTVACQLVLWQRRVRMLQG